MGAAMNISFIDFVRASVKEAAADGDYDHNLLRLLENHDDKGDVVEARAEEIDTDKLARRVTLVDSLSMMSYSASGPVPRIPTPIQALRHEVNEVDGIGLTPLFAAFLKGGGDALFTGLLEAGADPMQALIFQDGQNRQHSLVSLLAELNQNSPSVEIKARAAKALQMIRNHSRNCSRAADSSYLAVQHANVAGLAPIPDYMLDLSSEFFSGGTPIGIDPVNNDIVLDDGSRLRQVEAEVPHPHE